MTDAGRDYVESILLPGIQDKESIYALGRLQGLREHDAASNEGGDK
jgi:hypothetical protein